jgi:hypothetical protein
MSCSPSREGWYREWVALWAGSGSPLENGAHGRRPPLLTAVGGRDPRGDEIVGDLTEAPTAEALVTNALRHLEWDDRSASPRRLLEPRPCCASPVGGESLELVDGDQAGAPGQLDRLDVRQQPSEGGAADAKCLGGLAASVGEPFDALRLTDDHSRRRRGWPRPTGWSARLLGRLEVASYLVGAALLAVS